MGVKKSRLYEVLLPLLLLSAGSVLLYIGRALATGSTQFAFLSWNLFLAWLPLGFAWWLRAALKKQRYIGPKPVLLSILWFVFLPNSFYIVTDFIHLRPHESISLLYEAVMFMSFTISGLLPGLISVYLVHAELRKRLRRKHTYLVLGTVFLLSGFAIYLGRYLGWNTWDLLANPFGILIDTTDRLANPGLYPSTYTITLLFFLYITVAYGSFYLLIRALKSTK